MASHTDSQIPATAAWLMGKIGQPEFADPLKRIGQGRQPKRERQRA
jgi:hypothetical protein